MSTDKSQSFDAVILGAGFFGLKIAQELRESGLSRVLVLESKESAMERASYVNQARVHNGYHYPRSILTGFRSRVSSTDFVKEFEPAIYRDFEHVYAIARSLSKTNARQFEIFCERIGAPLSAVDLDIQAMFSGRMIEKSWVAQEFAFDSRKLKNLMLDKLNALGGVEIRYRSEAVRVDRTEAGVQVSISGARPVHAPLVVSCLYANVNLLHFNSQLEQLPLQHELTELALVRVPRVWENRALTVMDGPFFSLMPFPALGLHSLSHVRYTPQFRWEDNPGKLPTQPDRGDKIWSASTFKLMLADVKRYVSGMESLEYVDSLREIKTVLARNDTTDSRPILVRSDFGIDGYHCVLGSKIDNVGDVLEELKTRIGLGVGR